MGEETFKLQVYIGWQISELLVGKEEKIDKKELLREHVYTMVPNLNNSYHTEERTTLVLRITFGTMIIDSSSSFSLRSFHQKKRQKIQFVSLFTIACSYLSN